MSFIRVGLKAVQHKLRLSLVQTYEGTANLMTMELNGQEKYTRRVFSIFSNLALILMFLFPFLFQLKRSASASEQRAIDAEKRAKWRQQRMEALENDAKKAQAVIMKHKALSSTSLEGGALSAGEENEITLSTSLQS